MLLPPPLQYPQQQQLLLSTIFNCMHNSALTLRSISFIYLQCNKLPLTVIATSRTKLILFELSSSLMTLNQFRSLLLFLHLSKFTNPLRGCETSEKCSQPFVVCIHFVACSLTLHNLSSIFPFMDKPLCFM